jgi:hypothetical protein
LVSLVTAGLALGLSLVSEQRTASFPVWRPPGASSSSWLSYLQRYVPVGLLEVLPQKMSWRPPAYRGRSDLEIMLASENAADWVKISEMLLGQRPQGSSSHRSTSQALPKMADRGEVVKKHIRARVQSATLTAPHLVC